MLLLWGRKLLLSQLGSLIKSDASIDTLPDSLRLWCFDVCFQLKPNHDPGWLLCSSWAFEQKWKGTLVNKWQHGRLGSCYSNSVCKPGWEREVSSIMFYRQTLNWSKCKTFRCSEIPWLGKLVLSLLYCVDKRTVYCHNGKNTCSDSWCPNSQPSTSSCHVSQILSVMNFTIKDGIPWGEFLFLFFLARCLQLESHPYSPLPPVLGFINIYPSIHVKYQQNAKLVIFN